METGPATADPFAGITPESILIPNVGRGKALFFRDGKVQRGTWSQPNMNAPLRFYDARGHQVVFNPGQTWIEAVPPGSPMQWTVR
jgi:hypothetical protein